MNVYDITAVLDSISFAPVTEIEEIMQNVRTILTTTKYSVPLDRKFGINTDVVDMPINHVQAKLTADIVNAIEKYEPRVFVKKVSYSGDGADGQLVPTVRVVIK